MWTFLGTLVRNPRQRSELLPWSDDIVVAQITQPETLRHVVDDVDVVFSSIGITRQGEGLTYEDVDYRRILF
jgi:fibrillarin-like rRNA methylase